jgi:hypothetical protein
VSLTFHSALRKLNKEPSIGAPHQISVHLAKQFQRRVLEKSTNQKQELPMAAMFVNGSGQIEYLLYMFPTTFRFIWLSSFREEDF